MHTPRHTQQIGMTLIELLLYIGLSSVTLFITVAFLGTLTQARIKNQTVAEVEQQGVQAMQLMTQTIRNADAVLAPGVGVAAAALSLDAAGSVNDPTIFDLQSGALSIAEGGAPAVPLSSTRLVISGLSFQNTSRTGTPGTVRVQFTVTHVNTSGRGEYAYTKTFIGSATLRP